MELDCVFTLAELVGTDQVDTECVPWNHFWFLWWQLAILLMAGLQATADVACRPLSPRVLAL